MKNSTSGNVGLNDHSIAGGSYGAACKKTIILILYLPFLMSMLQSLLLEGKCLLFETFFKVNKANW